MIITINTDASFSHEHKYGTYAYWIKSDNFLYKGSGVFKDTVDNSTDAESRAIAVALWILKQNKHDFDVLVINRDNIGAKPSGKKPYQIHLKNQVKKYKEVLVKEYGRKIRKVKLKHVKAHTNVKDSRSYVNNWCDKACKSEFYKYKKNYDNIF